MEGAFELDPDVIAGICRRYQVRRLAVFGSILRKDFDPERSDADFLVEFEPLSAAQRLQSYFALRAALGDLLARPIDLVEAGAIQNPYILKKIDDQQRTLYAA
jgi:predicted nucleotidyltransferase